MLGNEGYAANDRILIRYFGGGILALLFVACSAGYQTAFDRKGRAVSQIWRDAFRTKMFWVNVQRGLLQLIVTLGVIHSSDYLDVMVLAAMDFIDRPVISAALAPLFRESVDNIGMKIFALAGSLVAAVYVLLQSPRSELQAWGLGGFWELLAAAALAVGAYQVRTGWTWKDAAGVLFRRVFRQKEPREITEALAAKKELAKLESKSASLLCQTGTGVVLVLIIWLTFSRVLPKFDMVDILPLVGLMSAAMLLMLFDLIAKRGNVATLSLYSITVPIFGLFWDTVRERRLPDQSNLVVAGILFVVAVITTVGEYRASSRTRS